MATITSIPGIKVGHATHPTEATGVTVVLCEDGATGGIDIRGSAPGTRETELLRPGFLIQHVHAIVLTGGSAYGLRAVDGTVRYLSEKGIGYRTGDRIVPIVPAAVIFDLHGNRNTDFPDAQMGYDAARNARSEFEEGLVGAGKGATVGKALGLAYAMAGGVGSFAAQLPADVWVGALAVVNALGDVIDPETGKIVAGARSPRGSGFADTFRQILEGKYSPPIRSTNTTLAVVATNVSFTKEQINKVAQMAQAGITRSTRPAHTMHDGDIVFALSLGKKSADVNVIGEVAAYAVSKAIVRAVRLGNSLTNV